MAQPASKDEVPSAKPTASYGRLAKSAAALNAASDQLGAAVARVDDTLRALNVGITAWVEIENLTNGEDEIYDKTELGYDKVKGKWGIALRRESGFLDGPGELADETWLFCDAPRALRMKSLPRFPALFEELIKQVDDTTARVELAIAQAEEVAAALAGDPPVKN
jgi:hypothetical protein